MTASTATAAPPPAVAPTDERLARRSPAIRFMIRPEFGAFVGAVVVWALFAWRADGVWLSWLGTENYLDVSATFGLTALAVALLMIGGEFDLSAGVMTGTTGMFTGILAVHTGVHVGLSLVMSLVIAVGIGLLNGVMVVWSKLPSFIVTLGTFFGLRGFNLWFTQQVADKTQVTGIELEPGYELGRWLFASKIFHIGQAGFGVHLLWFAGMALLATWVLGRTKIGNWVYAVGGNKDAARMIGVPATATKVGLFVTVAVCGWVHGQVTLFSTNRSNVTEGLGQEFYFIIAAVLGGCLLTGGFGSMIGAALGCLILGMTKQGITLAGWDDNLYFLFLGVILLVAAFANESIRRWASTASRPSQAKVSELQLEVAAEQEAVASIVERTSDD